MMTLNGVRCDTRKKSHITVNVVQIQIEIGFFPLKIWF